MNNRILKGFTLIELMIVVAIIAILAAIAYPPYINYYIRASRSAAQQFMMDIAQRQEQFLMDSRVYVETTAGDPAAGTVTALNMTAPEEVRDFYRISITTVATPPSYTITATPIAGTRQANDGVLTLNQAGVKTPANKWK